MDRIRFRLWESGKTFHNVQPGFDRNLHDIRGIIGITGGNRGASRGTGYRAHFNGGLQGAFRHRDRRCQNLDDRRVAAGDRDHQATCRRGIGFDEKRHGKCRSQVGIGHRLKVKQLVGYRDVDGFAAVAITRPVRGHRSIAYCHHTCELEGAGKLPCGDGDAGWGDGGNVGVGDRQAERCAANRGREVEGDGGCYSAIESEQRTGDDKGSQLNVNCGC